MSEQLHSQLSKLAHEIQQKSLDIKSTTEILRYFRNVCATDKESQIKLGDDGNNFHCVDLMCKLFDKLLERPASEENMVCLRVGCQFIGNLIVDNQSNQLKVHNKCFAHIRKLMLLGDGSLSRFCAMILYNIILSHPDVREDILKENDLLRAILIQEDEFSFGSYPTFMRIYWSILALRNICEKCPENQAIIAGLAKKDVAYSPVLEELGYTLHSEDGKGIKIAPLKRHTTE
ncbi:hypothetical protein LSTR_LSTR013419 [Laodelphax striatellus]|uniref:Ataxin-10 n=1 Tax=Laodelphax striatellus TaxID=195883 RepID=A0A482XRZ0_LAOST|nr:hypothetical protein LSTR_LSTR013419 [Laodelphax striatellus]